MEKEILQIIKDDDVNNLMQILKTKLPLSAPIINFLRIHLIWRNKLLGMKLKILCPRGDWRDGTVVAICEGLLLDEKIQLSVFADVDHIEELIETLRVTSQVQWDRIAVIPEIVVPIYGPMKDLLLTKIDREPFEDYCYLLYLPKEKAAKIEVQKSSESNVRVAPLEMKHLDTVLSLWAYNVACFIPVVRAIISHNITVGVFLDDKLVSWAVEAERGGVGIVITLPQYTRRGFASIAVSHLIRAMGQAGSDVHSTVDVVNATSLKMHQKAGFESPCGENCFLSYMHSPLQERKGYPAMAYRT